MTRRLSLDPGGGQLSLVDAPSPSPVRGCLVVGTAFSVISTGTELSKVGLASKSLLGKVQERPDQVAKVLDAIRAQGVVATVHKVRERLATPVALGYSLSGTVLAVGEGVSRLRVGQTVACGGASACHADEVSIPESLALPVPPGLPLDRACFTTVASVALHGLRTGGVVLGDRVLIVGLGLIGQLAARLCVSAGAHVFGVDPRRDRRDLALSAGVGATDGTIDKSTAQQVVDWSAGRGADVVLLTAAGADSRPLAMAAAAARDRARVVVVGTLGLDVPRELFYEKELSLVVSRSYGPGRYDPAFEQRGESYPVGYVPWTERRNMEEILCLLAGGRLPLEGLRGTTLPFDRAPEAYHLLSGRDGPSPVAVVLDYGRDVHDNLGPLPTTLPAIQSDPGKCRVSSFEARPLGVSFLGMGNFATSYLLPEVRRAVRVGLEHVVTTNPLKAATAKRREGFRAAGTSADGAISARETHVIFIATRHDSHAGYVEAALRANKAVFVEKPLALNALELERVTVAVRATQGRLMVGFNRRFAAPVRWALDALGSNRADVRMLYRVNAGALPAHHWLLDPEVGGGRLLGEACHFIDLACYVAGAEATQVEARALDAGVAEGGTQDFHIGLCFENGATAEVLYLSSGGPTLAKEHIEIHRSGTSVVLDDFRRVVLHRSGRPRVKTWHRRDKGHRAEVHEFLEAVRMGAPTPIPEEESLRSTALTLAAARSILEGRALHKGEW